MNTKSRKLKNEAAYAVQNPLPGIQYGPVNDSLDEWQAIIDGPKDSAYHGTEVCVTIKVTNEYPFAPPVMTADIFHPNVYRDTRLVCMSILHNGLDPTGYEKADERWSAGRSIAQVLLSFQQIVIHPNLESPANPIAGREYRKDVKVFQKRVMDDYLKKQQNKAFKKCLEADKIKAKENEKKRGNTVQDDTIKEKVVAQKRHMLVNEFLGKRFKEDEKRAFFDEILPEEPGINEEKLQIKLRGKEKTFVRNFSPNDSVMSIFDYLSSQGVNASKLKVGVTGNPGGDLTKVIGRKLLNEVMSRNETFFIDEDSE